MTKRTAPWGLLAITIFAISTVILMIFTSDCEVDPESGFVISVRIWDVRLLENSTLEIVYENNSYPITQGTLWLGISNITISEPPVYIVIRVLDKNDTSVADCWFSATWEHDVDLNDDVCWEYRNGDMVIHYDYDIERSRLIC